VDDLSGLIPATGKLIYHFVKGCESGRQLLTDTLTAASELGLPAVKRSTLFDAFQRFPIAWFASLLSLLLTAVTWKAIPELDALGRLYCVDGSTELAEVGSVFPALATMAGRLAAIGRPRGSLRPAAAIVRWLSRTSATASARWLVGSGRGRCRLVREQQQICGQSC
jgi:hypothetical protein